MGADKKALIGDLGCARLSPRIGAQLRERKREGLALDNCEITPVAGYLGRRL